MQLKTIPTAVSIQPFHGDPLRLLASQVFPSGQPRGLPFLGTLWWQTLPAAIDEMRREVETKSSALETWRIHIHNNMCIYIIYIRMTHMNTYGKT